MFYQISKRIIDIIVSILALIAFTPLMLFVAFKIKKESPNGPIFADIPKRMGQNKVPFFMYKFRSMIPNAYLLIKTDPRFKSYIKKYSEQGKLKTDHDPRVLKIGKFIRKTDIDEIPQFINVLRGSMSIVGPRAYDIEELEGYLKKYPDINEKIDVVLSCKPGITGPWQVSGRNTLTIPERVRIDYAYAKRRNILYDISIMIKTPIVVFTRLGAFD